MDCHLNLARKCQSYEKWLSDWRKRDDGDFSHNQFARSEVVFWEVIEMNSQVSLVDSGVNG